MYYSYVLRSRKITASAETYHDSSSAQDSDKRHTSYFNVPAIHYSLFEGGLLLVWEYVLQEWCLFEFSIGQTFVCDFVFSQCCYEDMLW